MQDAASGPRADARLDGRRGRAADARDRRGVVLEPLARASSGARARPRATRSPSRSCATTATATRCCCASRPPARRVTPARSRASRPGSGARSPSARSSGRPARTRPSCSTRASARARARSARRPSSSTVAALDESDERVVEEAADLVYHLYVLLAARGLDVAAVEDELARRSAALSGTGAAGSRRDRDVLASCASAASFAR